MLKQVNISKNLNIKKLVIVQFLTFSYLNAQESISTLNLAIAASKKGNKEATVLLAAGLSPADLQKSTFQKAISPLFGDLANLEKEVDANKKKSAGGAAAANCLTQKQAEDLLKVPLPNVDTTAKAKTELVRYFESGTGHELLIEIGANEDQIKPVVTAIQGITVK